jgi:phosphoglycerate dehydrogenase-like enzyme
VFRAAADRPPPGVERGTEFADLRFAPDAAALEDAIAEAEVLFMYQAPREALVEAFPKASTLRWIQTGSAGVDGLLFPELVASDVIVTNARGVFDDAIAEWALGMMLAFATGIVRSVRDSVEHRWDSDRRTERLAGTRLVVVGPGPIGHAAARLARAAGMGVEAVGTRDRDDPILGRVHGPAAFHEALARADYVLNALPLAPGTRHRFDAGAFAAMKPSARFLNVGRGKTVDERALIEALDAGRLAGAGLDVFETEPLPPESPLWSMPNVVISPHICGDYEGWEAVVVDVFVDNLARYAAGEPLHNLVDKERGHGAG